MSYKVIKIKRQKNANPRICKGCGEEISREEWILERNMWVNDKGKRHSWCSYCGKKHLEGLIEELTLVKNELEEKLEEGD